MSQLTIQPRTLEVRVSYEPTVSNVVFIFLVCDGVGVKAFKGKGERDRELRLKIRKAVRAPGAAPSVERMPELCLRGAQLMSIVFKQQSCC